MSASSSGIEPDVARALLVVKYRPRLIRYFTRKLTRRRQDVEDLVQEVCVRFLECRTAWCSDSVAYLFGIAHNVYVDFVRSRRLTEASVVDSVVIDDLSSLSTRSPAENAMAQTHTADLLRRLPGKQRAMLVAQVVEGYSYAEIGLRYGLSRQTVEKYLFLAKSYLRAGRAHE